MTRVSRPAVGYALTLAAAAFFAVNGTVSTLALQAGVPAPRLTALRCTGAAIGLVAALAIAAPAGCGSPGATSPFSRSSASSGWR